MANHRRMSEAAADAADGTPRREEGEGCRSLDFGANLRRAREGAGVTRRDLARRAGIHPVTLRCYERGIGLSGAQVNPSFATFVALCQALEVRPRDLLPPYPIPCRAAEAIGLPAPHPRGRAGHFDRVLDDYGQTLCRGEGQRHLSGAHVDRFDEHERRRCSGESGHPHGGVDVLERLGACLDRVQTHLDRDRKRLGLVVVIELDVVLVVLANAPARAQLVLHDGRAKVLLPSSPPLPLSSSLSRLV